MLTQAYSQGSFSALHIAHGQYGNNSSDAKLTRSRVLEQEPGTELVTLWSRGGLCQRTHCACQFFGQQILLIVPYLVQGAKGMALGWGTSAFSEKECLREGAEKLGFEVQKLIILVTELMNSFLGTTVFTVSVFLMYSFLDFYILEIWSHFFFFK